MIHALGTYLKGEVWLRRRELATDSQFYLALGAGIAAASLAAGTELGDSKLGGVVTVILAYAAIAFGFSLAGLTLAITLPNAGFTRLLATAKLPDESSTGRLGSRGRRRSRMLARSKPPNAYRDLLFVFSWTAFTHWLVIAWALGVVVACGPDSKLLPDGASLAPRLSAGVLAFLIAYAALHFLVTLLTLAGVGRVYVGHLEKEHDEENGA